MFVTLTALLLGLLNVLDLKNKIATDFTGIDQLYINL